MKNFINSIALCSSILFLSACGGGSGGSTPAPDVRIDSLTFADNNLAACVTTAAAAMVNVSELTSLSCNIKSINDLTGIEALTSLTVLELGSNTITDISSIASLTKLTNLILTDNTITDVSSLSGLTNLTFLELRFNTITKVTPLASLINLTQLWLSDNSIANLGNIESLSTLTKATHLLIGNNKGMDCTSLGTLIAALGSPPVDTDGDINTTDTPTGTINCTNYGISI